MSNQKSYAAMARNMTNALNRLESAYKAGNRNRNSVNRELGNMNRNLNRIAREFKNRPNRNQTMAANQLNAVVTKTLPLAVLNKFIKAQEKMAIALDKTEQAVLNPTPATTNNAAKAAANAVKAQNEATRAINSNAQRNANMSKALNLVRNRVGKNNIGVRNGGTANEPNNKPRSANNTATPRNTSPLVPLTTLPNTKENNTNRRRLVNARGINRNTANAILLALRNKVANASLRNKVVTELSNVEKGYNLAANKRMNSLNRAIRAVEGNKLKANRNSNNNNGPKLNFNRNNASNAGNSNANRRNNASNSANRTVTIRNPLFNGNSNSNSNSNNSVTGPRRNNRANSNNTRAVNATVNKLVNNVSKPKNLATMLRNKKLRKTGNQAANRYKKNMGIA